MTTDTELMQAAIKTVAGLSPAERAVLRDDPSTVLPIFAYLKHAVRASLEERTPRTQQRPVAYRWTDRYGNVRDILPSEIEAVYSTPRLRRFRDPEGDIWVENYRGTFDCLLDPNDPSRGRKFTGYTEARLRAFFASPFDLVEIKS